MNLIKKDKNFLLELFTNNESNAVKVNSVDASKEKHVPVYEIKGNEVIVSVGSVLHPMVEEHYIEFIIIETKRGYQIKKCSPHEQPIATFSLVDDELLHIYEYCNIHGFWTASK